MEGYINLFKQDDVEGTNRPHYKILFKIDGVDHECALWPNRDGKKGFSGKYKPKQEYTHGLGNSAPEPKPTIADEAKNVFGEDVKVTKLDDEIPF